MEVAAKVGKLGQMHAMKSAHHDLFLQRTPTLQPFQDSSFESKRSYQQEAGTTFCKLDGACYAQHEEHALDKQLQDHQVGQAEEAAALLTSPSESF